MSDQARIWVPSPDCTCPWTICGETIGRRGLDDDPPDPCSFGHRPVLREPPTRDDVWFGIHALSGDPEAWRERAEDVLGGKDADTLQELLRRLGLDEIREGNR